MNFLKRALYSTWARKSRSIIILIVFVVIGVFVLSGLSIQSAVETSKDNARKQLGGTVTLSTDVEKAMAAAEEARSESSDESNTGRGGFLVSSEPLPVEQAEELIDSSYLKGYNYLSSSMALADNFDAVEADDSSSESETTVPDDAKGGMGGMTTTGDVTIEGTLFSDALDNFSDETYELTDGRHITDTDVDTNVVMISSNLAEANELEVGDKIKISSTDEETTLKLEVVGIFDSSEVEDARTSMMPMLSSSNTLIVPYTVASTLNGEDAEGTITSAVYYLSDPENLDAFLAEAENTSIDFDTFALDANNQLYEQMIEPIESVASFSKNIVYLVSIAGGIILMLIVTLSIKERRNEMGILLGLGEKKWKLASQFLAEILVLAVIGFGLSSAGGNFVASKISDQLLQQETTLEETSSGPTFGGSSNMQGGGMPSGGGNMMGKGKSSELAQSSAETVDLDVQITSQDLLTLMGLGLLLAAFSVLVPTLQIIRLHPRAILSRQE